MDIRNAYHRITGEPYSDYVGTHGLDVRTDLGGLNLSTVPKVFIECGDIPNAGDAARLASPRFRERAAAALEEQASSPSSTGIPEHVLSHR